jgi:hypothetical protein
MKHKALRAFSVLAVFFGLVIMPCAVVLMPAAQGVAAADKINLSSDETKKIKTKCQSSLGKNPSSQEVNACLSGYVLALEKAGTGDCNEAPYKGHPALVKACKDTGYDLGKRNAARVNVNGDNNKGQNKDPCTGSECLPTPTAQGSNCDSDHCDLVALYINPAINMLSILVGLVAAASLVMGGVQYASSSGDPQKTGAAKARITNTLLAFAAYLFLYAFLNFLIPGGLFG